MKINEYLKKQKLIIDGAMGTYFSKLEQDDSVFAEKANLEAPDKILQIHKEYIDAGARLIRTNTFMTSRKLLDITAKEQENMIQAAFHIAKEAVKQSAKEVYIAGDIGPLPENAHTDEEEVLEEYKAICDIFLKEKVEIILFETFSDLKYIEPLVKYIKEKSDVFIITDFCINKNGYSKTGVSAVKLLEKIAEIDEINAVGFNCGIGSGHMYQILKKLHFPQNKYIVAVPNAGYPEQLQNRMVFLDNTYYFVDKMKLMGGLGVNIVGGCCGTTPDYIKALAKDFDTKVTPRNQGIVSVTSITEQKELRKNEFYEKFYTGKKVIAVELDPPYDANYETVMECAHKLKNSGVDLITMADSPMGRSRVDSILMSTKLQHDLNVLVMPHVCCRDKNMIAMRSSILGAYINDIRNLLIVTGDPIPSESRTETTGVFDYNSIQLMNFVKEMNEEHFAKEPIYYGGALNYGRGNIEKVIERMQKKIEAGAKFFLTQPIYADEDIERIQKIKNSVDTKILCGIMPLVSYRNANFIRNEFTGIHVPDEIMNRYHIDMSREEGELVGATIANEIIEKLNPFADGYYFMLPFNRVSLMDKIKITK